MKSFRTYLTESHKTYDFKVRIACDLPDDLLDKVKSVLEAYKVSSVSKPRRLPIQETPEFPNCGPVAISIMDISLHYPCNDEQVRTLIAERAGIAQSYIKVTPANSPYEAVADGREVSNLDGKEGQSVLMQHEMKAQPVDKSMVGDVDVANILKELEETRKYQYPELQGGETEIAKTTNELPTGTHSPLGNHKPKLPKVGR